MRTMLWLLTAAVVLVGSAHAQVAAPNLSPATAGLEAPRNAGVQAWERTRVLGGFGEAEIDDLSFADDPDFEGDVVALQGTWVGETFSVGAESSGTSLEPTSSLITGSLDLETTRLALAAQFAEAFSLGLGQQTDAISGTLTVGSLSFPVDVETTQQHVGGTARVGEAIHLGLRYGMATTTEPGQQDAEQDEYYAGVGGYWQEGANGLHVEVFTGNRELYDVAGTADDRAEVDTTGFTLEALWSAALIGYESVSAEASDTTGASSETETATISLGWVPEQGVTAVLQLNSSEDLDSTGNVIEESEATLVSVGWMF